jgi:hypothetical protein
MRNFYYCIGLAIIYFIPVTAIAQAGSITGRLSDEKGGPLPYATITLLKVSDSTLAATSLTNPEGSFSLKVPAAGNYFLRFTSIGFAEKRTDAFEISANDIAKDLGNITLAVMKKTLKEVTVQSIRPTIRQLADRMVVSIEGTALAAGNTAFDVLARAPGVFIDHEGNIQLNGRSGVTLMLDGKLTYLSARELRTLLQSMPAENLKNIEIITNPSAKYDAEGSSGILNINLKKNDRQGMNGSVYAGHTYNFKQHGYSAGGNINYKSGSWNSFLNLDFARRVGGREATFTRVFYATQKTTYFDQVATGNFSVVGPPSVRLGTDYSLNFRHSIGVMANYNTNYARQEFLTDTYIGSAANTPALYIDADNLSRNRWQSFTSNVHYVGKLDTSGTSLTADVDYAKIRNSGDSYFYNYFDTLASSKPVGRDFLYTNTPNGFDIYSAKVDYSHPFKKGSKFEMGAKASRVLSDNDSKFYFNNNQLILDPKRTNHFNYRENIYAGYVNMSGDLSKQVTVQGGLRLESTQSLGNSLTTGQVTRRNYTNLFPSVFIQQKVNDNYGINYSYSRRLQRPNYGNLNPFRFYRDPYTYIEGNPYLRPQYAHSFSVTQTFRKTYNVTISYQLTKDVISELPMLDVEKTTTIYYTGNVDDGHNVGMTAIAPLKISKKWESQNTLIVSYNKFTMTSNVGRLVNDQLFYMLQSNHTVQLPLDLRMELNLLYRGPAASGLYQMAPMHRVDVGLKKSFAKKKLEASINANDIFKGYRFRWTTDIAGNINEFDQYMRFRTLAFTLRYNFSKGIKVDSRRRNNSLEELNRAGG